MSTTEMTAATESALNVESIKGMMDAFDPAPRGTQLTP